MIDHGWAWINPRQKRPICSAREIRRGFNKGKVEIRLCRGRKGDGSIKPGKKKIVPFYNVIEFPPKK